MSNIIAKAVTTTTPKLYLDFFKRYYKEKTRALVIVTTIIGICCVLAGLYACAVNKSVFVVAVLIAGGGMLAVYPRFSYRKPYNSVKNNVITTKFEFYEDRLVEINDATKEEYEYSGLMKVWETPEYFYIYHTKENASVVDKAGFTLGTPEELARALKCRLPYTVK
ncbi:MAG: YcxB family protein [Candidatus Ornithomonoglobus sp.]